MHITNYNMDQFFLLCEHVANSIWIFCVHIINLFFCMHIKSRLIKCCCLKVSTNMIISWWDIMDKKFRQMNNLVSTDSLVHYAENGGNIRKQYLIFTWTSQIRRLIMGKLLYNWNHKESNSYISSSLSMYLKQTFRY